MSDALRCATDAQLRDAEDRALADLTLAERYEHNAHLVPKIRAHIDAIWAEKSRRAAPYQRNERPT